MMSRIMGNDKKGIADNNILLHKQKRLLRPLGAVIFAYDNYQRGLSLQHQRGAHSTAFFRGTHQCCHKVIYFDDVSFDSFYVDFTQHEQAIPSPWGMPAFENIDVAAPSVFLLDHSTFKSITTPDFTGSRVNSYIKLRDICCHLRMIDSAFSSPKDGVDVFDQCPADFNKPLLESFRSRCKGRDGRKLFDAARSFQVETVKRWNKEIDDPILSMYSGLLAIDESASKECGAITLIVLA